MWPIWRLDLINETVKNNLSKHKRKRVCVFSTPIGYCKDVEEFPASQCDVQALEGEQYTCEPDNEVPDAYKCKAPECSPDLDNVLTRLPANTLCSLIGPDKTIYLSYE